MKKILITGGAGFIGSHLVDRLVQTGSSQVVVLDNLHRGRLQNLAASRDRIEFIQGDVRDRSTVETAVRGVDTVYHLAAQSNVLGAVSDLDYSFSTNVRGTLEVLRAASSAGARRFIFTSSREVYGDPTCLPVTETAPIRPKNAYGASKAAGEAYCASFNSDELQIRIVRLANVYGERDVGRVIPIFIDRALRNEALTVFGGEQVIDFVWIEHAVEGLIRAAEADRLPGPVNIGAGTGTSLRVLARRIIKAANSSSELQVAPARDVDVVKFVADTFMQEEYLGLQNKSEDPLAHLPALVNALRAAESARSAVAADV